MSVYRQTNRPVYDQSIRIVSCPEKKAREKHTFTTYLHTPFVVKLSSNLRTVIMSNDLKRGTYLVKI